MLTFLFFIFLGGARDFEDDLPDFSDFLVGEEWVFVFFEEVFEEFLFAGGVVDRGVGLFFDF